MVGRPPIALTDLDQHGFLIMEGVSVGKVKFVQIKDNEWFQPTMRGHLMKCCDCGLIHSMNFRIVKNRVQIRAKRKDL